MKNIVAATVLTLASLPASLLFTPQALADTYTTCYPVIQSQVSRDAADHPGAYRDGYQEGRESRREGEAYNPRSAGGEFARGFEDGYFGRPFSGQQYRVPDRVDHYTTQQCNTYQTRYRGGWRRHRGRVWIR